MESTRSLSAKPTSARSPREPWRIQMGVSSWCHWSAGGKATQANVSGYQGSVNFQVMGLLCSWQLSFCSSSKFPFRQRLRASPLISLSHLSFSSAPPQFYHHVVSAAVFMVKQVCQVMLSYPSWAEFWALVFTSQSLPNKVSGAVLEICLPWT